MKCRVDECDRPSRATGLCNAHYLRARRGQEMSEPRIIGDLDARFWQKVSGGDFTDCWLWTASLNSRGYGQLMVNGTPRRAHRIAYELLRAEIPAGLVLDHLCEVKACVNPWHLEPVTQAVNVARHLKSVS